MCFPSSVKSICMVSYIHFFNKQAVYKQLVLGWQIAKQLSGLNLRLLSNNKNYRSKKSGFFLCNKREIAVKETIHQNLAVSNTLFGKFQNH